MRLIRTSFLLTMMIKFLKLLGNVYVKNFESEGISIEKTSGDELMIFSDTRIFEFISQNKKRVKTKIKF